MNKNEFAKKYGYETFKDTIMNTLDFTLDQLEFSDEEKSAEEAKLEVILTKFENIVMERFADSFTDEEMTKIENYLTQETPDYMRKFTQIHTELNEEFGDKILEALEDEDDAN
jgi:hypothetical protein